MLSLIWTCQHPPPPSEAAVPPSYVRADSGPAPCDVPPTPPADRSPRARRVSLGNPPAARDHSPPPIQVQRIPNGVQSLDATSSACGPKHECVEALQSMLLSSIPELGHMDVTGELDIIDLTTLNCEMTDSPAGLMPGLPSPQSDRCEERKRTVEPEWNERQETPNKRQRTAEAGEGPATQDAMMEGSNLPEFNDAFLRSLIESAETDQTAVSPAPALPVSPAPRGDRQGTEPSPVLEAKVGSKGNKDDCDQKPERGQEAPSVPQPATTCAVIPPMGLLTPQSPTPTTIPPFIPRPARPSESGSQPAPVVVAPVSAPTPAPAASASVAPALGAVSGPAQASPQPPVVACPPPPPSTPAPLSRPAPTSSSSSPSVPPPQPPPTRSIPTTTTARPPLPPLSVPMSSSSRKPPVPSSASPSVPSPQVPPVTPVVDALASINLSLPSPTNAVQLPTVPVASPSKPEPPKKLGINHIDLIYRRVGSGYYLCRFCE